MVTLDDAIILAAESHRRQVGRDGLAYILHPLRLMLQMDTETERIVAVLHDVVEDSDVTLDDLRRLGYDEVVIEAVDRLSRRNDETYEQFIERIAPNPLAVKVKLADLADNMYVRKLVDLNDDDRQRLVRYRAAVKRLGGALPDEQ